MYCSTNVTASDSFPVGNLTVICSLQTCSTSGLLMETQHISLMFGKTIWFVLGQVLHCNVKVKVLCSGVMFVTLAARQLW